MSKESVNAITRRYERFLSLSAELADLPLDDWLETLERAESCAEVVDPTLFRNYLFSKKPVILKNILRAAQPLQRAIREARLAIAQDPALLDELLAAKQGEEPAE